MAISTINTFLMVKKADGKSGYEKLIDIKDFPDMGGTPESIDVTTLSDGVQKNIPGIQKMDILEFTANYTKEDFQKLRAMRNQVDKEFAVVFGAASNGDPDGHNGIFKFKGQLDCALKGSKTNEAVEMTVSIAASTAPEMATSL